MSEKFFSLNDILVVAPHAWERSRLISLLHEVGINGNITEIAAIPDAAKTLTVTHFDLCLVSHAFGEDEQLFLVRSVVKRLVPGKTAMVIISTTADYDTMRNFINCGAHGILHAPLNPESVRETIASAIRRAQSGESPEDHLQEILSLPWILEQVSRKLEYLAAQIREQKETDKPTSAAVEILKSLLSNLLPGTKPNEQSIDEFVSLLLKGTGLKLNNKIEEPIPTKGSTKVKIKIKGNVRKQE